MFRCARIQGLTTCEGLLLFGREHYYVVDGFTLLKTREIRDLDFLSSELHDPIVPYTATGATAPPKVSKLCSKFSYDDIREVHKRRSEGEIEFEEERRVFLDICFNQLQSKCSAVMEGTICWHSPRKFEIVSMKNLLPWRKVKSFL